MTILREGQGGTSVKALCAKHNISEPTCYKWKQKYGGLEVSDVRGMQAMAEEISQLKRIVVCQVSTTDPISAYLGTTPNPLFS